jgi:FMN phosphatase YigB (HAD superfamily)
MIGDSLEKDVLGAKTAEMQAMRFHKGMTLTIPK